MKEHHIKVIRLDLAKTLAIDGQGKIWRHSGPDRDGRILYAEEGSDACHLVMRTISAQKTEVRS